MLLFRKNELNWGLKYVNLGSHRPPRRNGHTPPSVMCNMNRAGWRFQYYTEQMLTKVQRRSVFFRLFWLYQFMALLCRVMLARTTLTCVRWACSPQSQLRHARTHSAYTLTTNVEPDSGAMVMQVDSHKKVSAHSAAFSLTAGTQCP